MKKNTSEHFFRKYADKRFYLALNNFFFRYSNYIASLFFIFNHHRMLVHTKSLWYDSFNVSIEFHSFQLVSFCVCGWWIRTRQNTKRTNKKNMISKQNLVHIFTFRWNKNFVHNFRLIWNPSVDWAGWGMKSAFEEKENIFRGVSVQFYDI